MATETKKATTAKTRPALNIDAVAAAVAKAPTLKEKITVAKQELAIHFEERVEIPEVPGLAFAVRPMPMGVRLDLVGLTAKGQDHATRDYFATLVHESTYDPDTGDRVWGAKDRDEVLALPPEIFTPLAAAAQRVNAATQEADDALGNASGTTATDAGSSD